MKRFRPTIHYSLIQALYFALYASSISSTSLFLLHKGFTNHAIGAIIALGGVLSAFVQPILGKIADRAQRSILRRLITCNCIVCLVLIGVILAPFTGAKILTVLYIVLIAAVQSIIPMCSALAMFYSDRGVKVDFGIGRGFGSFGFSICAAIVGSMAAAYSPDVTMYISFVVAILLMLVTVTFRFKGVSEINEHRSQASAMDDNFLAEHKSFIPVLIGV
ncbi:MAG: MFS transporter, partial [Clostridia bacterium]|nr:MFS transporter [Clostridia bacterium]